MDEKIRCSWAGNIPIYMDYHDNEWDELCMTTSSCLKC
jgi:3-methyladenine DNA glycosylase Tag